MSRIFEYFLKNFFLFHRYDPAEIDIHYGKNDKSKIQIVQEINDNFFSHKQDISPENIIWKNWKGKRIPFCFGESDKKEILTEKNNKIIINYDIVASAFYFLSGWNEYVNPSKDEFGRISYSESIVKKLNIVSLPVVNYYFDILKTALERTYKIVLKQNIWQKNEFAVFLSHDIDVCRRAWLEGSFSELKKKHFLSLPKLFWKRFFAEDDWFNFNKITEIEIKSEAVSTFFFLPQKGKIGKFKNADYDISSPKLQKVLKYLADTGNEIGVHGSFGTHLNANLLHRDLKRIGKQNIGGNRFHFLLFDVEKTPKVLSENSLKYDSTLGFAEQIGFRRGTCYPFFLYDFADDSISDVLEIPLTIMDTTLFHTKYMNISPQNIWENIADLTTEVKKFHGVLTLLWHNTYFSDYKYTGWRDVYIELLRIFRSENALLTTGKQIYETICK